MTAIEILTNDNEMKRIIRMAQNVSSSRATVLIQGESGTGKELFANLIHQSSPRSVKRFVAINCAAMPEGLLESELFGFEKGAFTGAHMAKAGKFELAHEGTILLDEIGELPLVLQAKLLRVLQEGEIERLGSRVPTKVNVRVVAATNRDLASMVRRGEFREDLYYRLNVVPIVIPPLRKRKGDILPLANFFARVSSHMNNRPVRLFSFDAEKALLDWDWPGNVRELENVVERAVLYAVGDKIERKDIVLETPFSVQNDEPIQQARVSLSQGAEGGSQGGSPFAPGMTVSEAERLLIMKTLEYTEQNRTQAAKLLGISIRTLRNKLHEYGVKNGRSF